LRSFEGDEPLNVKGININKGLIEKAVEKHSKMMNWTWGKQNVPDAYIEALKTWFKNAWVPPKWMTYEVVYEQLERFTRKNQGIKCMETFNKVCSREDLSSCIQSFIKKKNETANYQFEEDRVV